MEAVLDQSIGNASIFYKILKKNPDNTSVKEALMFCFKHSFCIKGTSVFALQDIFQLHENRFKFMQSLSNYEKGFILHKFGKMIENNQINLFKLLLNEKTPYLIDFLKSYAHTVSDDLSLINIAVILRVFNRKSIVFLEHLVGLRFLLNIPGASGYTPLHTAASINDVISFDLLISAGADRHVINEDGLTPYALAYKEDKKEILEYYRKNKLCDEALQMPFFDKGEFPCFRDDGSGALLFHGWSFFDSEINKFNDKSLYGDEFIELSFEKLTK
ncbi:hypothetical protein COB28_03185 [Candidatus Dependentiae bacterium]|nr:MAG: hypothetical protein COB28_03185 [Candidatus Dependentiae bacterium]